MRTSLNDLRAAEQYILGTMPLDEALVFQARLLTNPTLRCKVNLQRKVYTLLRIRQRRHVKAAVEDMHEQLFADPTKAAFQEQIFSFFNPEKL
ncbi:hypothetical protein [Chryseolinea lacunae]|uniref:Uncharacterized protein n=1 Tax=Chryseolinea lacunae TaxID=2801331 RepID=A0ABS1KY83_9BACT|nr:hypothetical protein [Chryseolinea lacunae]MBL0743301.1 hypothetical protein [Chryseolinea lacunae]